MPSEERGPSREGIVVKTLPYRESDIICRVLTRTEGKCGILVRSARKENSRFKTHFDVFDHGHFETSMGHGSLESLKWFRPITSFRSLREDLDKYIAASILAETYDLLVHEDTHHWNPEIFEALLLGLQAINGSHTIEEILRGLFFSVLAALQLSGFASPEEQLQPTTKSLTLLLQRVMDATGREMQSFPSLIDIVRRLKNQVSAKSDLERS